MKNIASKVIALSLAAAFALATPAFAQGKEEKAPVNPYEQQYKDLKKLLKNMGATPSQASATQTQNGTLPNVFAKAIQGCTTDGYVFRMPYNLVFNFDELAAPADKNTPESEKSLFYRMVQPAPDSILGVSGTDKFIDALKAMTSGIHTSMKTVAGHLIDEAPSEFITRPIFNELAALAVEKITKEFSGRYGVTIKISPEQPRKQGGRCATAEVVEVPSAPAP